jgi:CRISPR-associated endonuclease Cas2
VWGLTGFEIQVKNAKTRTRLENALKAEIDPKIDSVRIYAICANCMSKASVLGKEPDAFDRDGVYFF